MEYLIQVAAQNTMELKGNPGITDIPGAEAIRIFANNRSDVLARIYLRRSQ